MELAENVEVPDDKESSDAIQKSTESSSIVVEKPIKNRLSRSRVKHKFRGAGIAASVGAIVVLYYMFKHEKQEETASSGKWNS